VHLPSEIAEIFKDRFSCQVMVEAEARRLAISLEKSSASLHRIEERSDTPGGLTKCESDRAGIERGTSTRAESDRVVSKLIPVQQPLKAFAKMTRKGRWDDGFVRRPTHTPGASRLEQPAVASQEIEYLPEIVGTTLRAPLKPFEVSLVELHWSDDGVDHPLNLGPSHAFQRDLEYAPIGFSSHRFEQGAHSSILLAVSPFRDEEEKALLLEFRAQIPEKSKCGRIGPLDVVEKENGCLLSSKRAEYLAECEKGESL
jgi:hypothetical protein